jgi:hypothetical protein
MSSKTIAGIAAITTNRPQEPVKISFVFAV